jgi:hypothetical protein
MIIIGRSIANSSGRFNMGRGKNKVRPSIMTSRARLGIARARIACKSNQRRLTMDGASELLQSTGNSELTHLIFHLFHLPVYILKWFEAVFYHAPRVLLTAPTPTERDVVDLLESTTLSLLLQSHNNDEWSFEVQDCRLVSFDKELGSIKIRYTRMTSPPCVLSCCRNGQELDDASMIFSWLFVYLTTSLHTKTHVFSNKLIQQLHSIKPPLLSASTYHTLPLHSAALHSTLSPLRFESIIHQALAGTFLFDMGVDRASLLLEEKNLSALAGHQEAAEVRLTAVGSRFSLFIARSRPLLLTTLMEHEISFSPFDTEALFNHTIVHSLDHYAISRVLHNVAFSMKPWSSPPSLMDIMKGQIFTSMFAEPTFNSLWTSNLIKDVGRGVGWTGANATVRERAFWLSLHVRLSEIDEEFADQITASIMF